MRIVLIFALLLFCTGWVGVAINPEPKPDTCRTVWEVAPSWWGNTRPVKALPTLPKSNIKTGQELARAVVGDVCFDDTRPGKQFGKQQWRLWRDLSGRAIGEVYCEQRITCEPPRRGVYLVDGRLTIDAQAFDEKEASESHAWAEVTVGMKAEPNSGTNNADYTTGPRLGYIVNIPTAGKYYVWLAGWGQSSDDSLYVSIGDQVVRFYYVDASPTWTNEDKDGVINVLDITAPGRYMLNVSMREDGTWFKGVMLTTYSAFSPN